MANIDLKYSKRQEIIGEPTLAVNYDRRIPSKAEGLPDVKNDPFVSLVSKSFYVLVDGDSKLTSDNVQMQGLNSPWLVKNNKTLQF
jgi:hypothetical protein